MIRCDAPRVPIDVLYRDGLGWIVGRLLTVDSIALIFVFFFDIAASRTVAFHGKMQMCASAGFLFFFNALF
jgi:hypothetical protein